MGEIAENAKLAKLCVNCKHLGTAHAKINIRSVVEIKRDIRRIRLDLLGEQVNVSDVQSSAGVEVTKDRFEPQ